MYPNQQLSQLVFLSTLSLRRATALGSADRATSPDFYPRSPCGERRPTPPTPCAPTRFLSTLSLRRATITITITCIVSRFLSTLSLRRATHYGWSWYDDFTISIHALLAESDPQIKMMGAPVDNFYPRSPCGERRRRLWLLAQTASFLSTLSLRRATRSYTRPYRSVLFLSTLSLRRATTPHDLPPGGALISIHALLAESDGPPA